MSEKGIFVENLRMLYHIRELKMGNFKCAKCLEPVGSLRPPPNYRLPVIVRDRPHLAK